MQVSVIYIRARDNRSKASLITFDWSTMTVIGLNLKQGVCIGAIKNVFLSLITPALTCNGGKSHK